MLDKSKLWLTKIIGKRIAIIVLAFLFSLGILVAYPSQVLADKKVKAIDVEQLLKLLPNGDRWKEHLADELLPFWEMDIALGEPVGNFPTYRCNDGSLYNPSSPCPELKYAAPGIVWVEPDYRDYVRAKSRQVYAYGVAFHVTGDETYLNYAQAGSDYLRKYALDRQNGGAYTYWHEPEHLPGPEKLQRTSQDLAYALSGMGFYYYLTRDPAVLEDIIQLKDYIFDTYYNPVLDLVNWVKEPSPDGDQTNQKELVAQLDQIYGYMLWLTPTLPEPYQTQWKGELNHLAHIIINQFYSPKQNLFWGAVTNSNIKHLGTPHTDFGHSVKTMWLIYQIGKLTDDLQLTLFAETHAAEILETAYLKKTGSWARGFDENGKIDPDKEWWILAELDQVSATLGLVDPSYAVYLPKTYNYWFNYMVDPENKEIWHMVSAKTNKPYPCVATQPVNESKCFPKQHSWKNALHSFEHALVGYITMQQIHNQPVHLYYAFKEKPEDKFIYPYFYEGKVSEIVNHSSQDNSSQIQEVIFTDIL